MATDGSRIVYNPAFVDELKPAELEGTLAHEVLHCALGHQCRRGERDPELWNVAADFAINPILIGNGFVASGRGAHRSCLQQLERGRNLRPVAAEKKRGRRGNKAAAADECWRGNRYWSARDRRHDALRLRSQTPRISRFQINVGGRTGEAVGPASVRPGGFGEVWDATDEHGQTASPAEKRRQEHEWGIAAEQALRSAKAWGHEPAGIERPLSESRQSQQDWRAILRDFVAATTPSDYRWTPPNRRYIASGLYLPSVERQGVGEIVIAVDTSGSIGKHRAGTICR